MHERTLDEYIGFFPLANEPHDMCMQSRNLLKAGYDVTVWNRSPEKCKMLQAEGAKVAASPEDATAACDITFAMLADPPAALAVAEQAAKGLSQGQC